MKPPIQVRPGLVVFLGNLRTLQASVAGSVGFAMGRLNGDSSRPVWVGEVTVKEDCAEDYESDDGGEEVVHGICSPVRD